MEVIVSASVGVLTAISLAGLSTPGLSGELAIACRRIALILRGVERKVRHARDEIEVGLAAHGVLTPRRRAERDRIERAMPEAFGSLAVSLARVCPYPRRCSMWAAARRSRCIPSSYTHLRL